MATLPKSPAGKVVPPRRADQRTGERSIAASQAKSHLLELLDSVSQRRQPVTITKRGRPVARLIPVEPHHPTDIFGCMNGTFRINGDVVGPEPDDWEAMR